MLANIIYTGTVRHRRFSPKCHSFRYKIFMLCLDLDDIENTINKLPFTSYEKFNWISFKRKNYIGDPGYTLEQHIRKLLTTHKINSNNKKIYLISHLSFFGYSFNPISLYIVGDENRFDAIIVEVHNTPWGDKHSYVLTDPVYSKHPIYKYQLKKKLHVSPFMTMDFDYHFNFKITQENMILHIQSIRNNRIYFDATLSMKGESLNKINYLNIIKKHPLMTYKVIFAIYWQAFLLWLKGIPFISKPKDNE